MFGILVHLSLKVSLILSSMVCIALHAQANVSIFYFLLMSLRRLLTLPGEAKVAATTLLSQVT